MVPAADTHAPGSCGRLGAALPGTMANCLLGGLNRAHDGTEATDEGVDVPPQVRGARAVEAVETEETDPRQLDDGGTQLPPVKTSCPLWCM